MTIMKKFIRFCNDNVVMIAGVSIIIGIHWTWLKLQNVPTLVRPEEKKELPLFIAARKLKDLTKDKFHELTGTGPKSP